eukprot:COSAG01_NODE_21119_length_917_cov_0.980440_2_plen_48_part_00
MPIVCPTIRHRLRLKDAASSCACGKEVAHNGDLVMELMESPTAVIQG